MFSEKYIVLDNFIRIIISCSESTAGPVVSAGGKAVK